MNIKGWQAVIFAATFFTMVSRHSALAGWAMSKQKVHSNLGFSTTVIGSFDTVFLFFYALGNFVCGSLGDRYSARIVVPIGLTVAAACYGAVFHNQIALLGLADVSSIGIFYLLFAICGFSQAGVWPGGVAVISNWFSPSKRGVVMGFWAPSAAVGNIVGEQVAGLYFDVFDFKWEMCMFTTACLMLVSAGLFAMLVSQRPHESLLETEERGTLQTAKVVSETLDANGLKKRSISFWKAWLIPG